MNARAGLALGVVVSLGSLGAGAPRGAVVDVPVATAARTDQAPAEAVPRDRARLRVGALALVVLGLIALVLVGMGMFMLIVRWSRRTQDLRRGPVHTDMEDLWVAAGKKDLPPPPEDDEN